MPNYRHKTTGQYPVTEQEIRALFPNIMFPAIFQHEDYDLVFDYPRPAYDSVIQIVQEIAPVFTVKDHWEQQWEVVELFPVLADKNAAIAANLAALIAAFIKQVDDDTDAIIKSVIGNRQSEYELAEREALAFKSAGYSGTVPASVSSWAAVKVWTATQAADDILLASTSWRVAQAAIRANRLAVKEAARNAANISRLTIPRDDWNMFVIAIKAQWAA